MPIIETRDDAHARQVAEALVKAAGDDPSAVETVTGQNGRIAYRVSDELAKAAEAKPAEPAKAAKAPAKKAAPSKK